MWSSGLVFASLNTIQSHAYIFTNLQGVVLVIVSLLIGIKLKKLELFGMALVVVGCLSMILDPRAVRTDGEKAAFWLSLIVLLTSVPGAFYFLVNSKLVKTVPIFALLLIMNVNSFILNALLAKIMNSSETKIFSIDKNYGCFGFFSSEAAFMAFVPFGLVSALLGSAGYVICLLFFSPLVCTNAFLLQPYVAQILGYAFGIDSFPGFLTILGTLMTGVGIYCIDRGSRVKIMLKNKNYYSIMSDDMYASSFDNLTH